MTNTRTYDDECVEYNPDNPDCEGPVEFRMALHPASPTPRCDKHWAERLEREKEYTELDAYAARTQPYYDY